MANQLDTRPGRAVKAYIAFAIPLGAPLRATVLIAPYDLREMSVLGDSDRMRWGRCWDGVP
jgi:hypothetical protein